MTPKMIATDLDRTLLRTDKTLSDYTISIFRRCRERGIKLVFATSRPMPAVLNFDFYRQIAPDGSLFHCGAAVFAEDNVIEKNGISKETVREMLLTAYRDASVELSIESGEDIHCNTAPLDLWPCIKVHQIDYANPPALYADKIVFTDISPKTIDAVSKLLPDSLYMEISENKIGMIMSRNATKARGVKRLAAHFGVSLSDVVAFGDDYNDIGMLQECGVGVAVANAIDEAKAAADVICGDNDSDGIAKWLEVNALT